MSLVVCPGSFDPVTNGHLDIVTRSAAMFDEVIVAVLQNMDKRTRFTAEERVALFERAAAPLSNVRVVSFTGLLMKFCEAAGADAIVKGLRAVSDYEYEVQMALLNRRVGGIETVFLAASPEYTFLSSSMVRDVGRHGGDISPFVPPAVLEDVLRILGRDIDADGKI